MSEEILEDACVPCQHCSGESSILIYINDELRCPECIKPNRECA